MTNQPKQQWGSRLGVILAVSGSAVGLGNFLRFPGNAAENGGGAFMIPYFLALLLLGIPIGWAEWTMGRYGGRKGFHGAPAILGVFTKGPVGRYLGVFGVLIPLGVYFYYVLIETWCLYFVVKYFTGGIGIDITVDDFFDAHYLTRNLAKARQPLSTPPVTAMRGRGWQGAARPNRSVAHSRRLPSGASQARCTGLVHEVCCDVPPRSSWQLTSRLTCS